MRSGHVQYEEDLAPLMVPIDSITQRPDNYNNGAVEEIILSITENGMYRPVYVDRDTREIFAGNHTWQACKMLDAEIIPVIFTDADSDMRQIKRMIADNRTAALARPDLGQLAGLLEVLAAEESLVGTGYTDYDLDVLKALIDIPNEPAADFAQWPTLMFQVPPHVKAAYVEMTAAAGDDREKFELLLRLAGWDGHKV